MSGWIVSKHVLDPNRKQVATSSYNVHLGYTPSQRGLDGVRGSKYKFARENLANRFTTTLVQPTAIVGTLLKKNGLESKVYITQFSYRREAPWDVPWEIPRVIPKRYIPCDAPWDVLSHKTSCMGQRQDMAYSVGYPMRYPMG